VWWPEPWWVSKRALVGVGMQSTCGEGGRYPGQKGVKEIKGGEEAEE